MSTENSFHPSSVAARVIDFLTSLHGMDEYDPSLGFAAIDLVTGMVVRPDAHFPDGALVKVQFAGQAAAAAVSVHTHKLVEALLLRHAEAMVVIDGGDAREQYRHINDHFYRKTGFGSE